MRVSAGDKGSDDRAVLVVLCASTSPQDRPRGMAEVERAATVRYTDAAGLGAALDGADVLLVWDPLTDSVRPAWPPDCGVQWVHVAAAGVDRMLFPAVAESGVTLTNSRGIFENSIAEFVLGAVLAFAKDLPGNLRLQADREWRHRETERIEGTTVLISGTGPIGRATARLLRAVGMRVTGMGRTVREDDPDFGTVHSDDDLHAVLGTADYVVALAPLTARTKHMFDAAAFAAMRPTARLVNVGRGDLVVEADLAAALRDGTIAGAALDVFATEPLPEDSALWAMANVLVSAHLSGDFVGWRDALAALFVDNFTRWLAGEPLRNVVDKRLGYVPGP